jgi:tetratricopeptide (TPR) repeat protein
MFCKKCGTESSGTKKFCTNCGTAFSTAQSTETAEAADPRPIRPPMPKEPWTTGRIVKTVIAVVFVGGLIFLKFGLGAINSIDSTAVDTNNKGLSAYDSGNSDQAISQFQQASQDAVTNDTKVNTLKNLAYVYSSESKNDLALSTFEEALALTSNGSFDYYLISGEIALLEGKPNGAQIAYNKAYQLEPNEFQINNALALFYLDLEEMAPQYTDYKKALTHAQKAYDLSKLEIAKQNLAIAYYFNENYNQTISLLSTSNFTSHPYAAYWLGLAYAQKEDPVNAKLYFRKAIAGGAVVPQEIYDYIANN